MGEPVSNAGHTSKSLQSWMMRDINWWNGPCLLGPLDAQPLCHRGSPVVTHLFAHVRTAGFVFIVAVISLTCIRAAEAQSRGTVQARATVVNTTHASGALQAVRSALQAMTSSMSVNEVATLPLATVVGRKDERSSRVLVLIEYSRN
jgi:hypothetical protein